MGLTPGSPITSVERVIAPFGSLVQPSLLQSAYAAAGFNSTLNGVGGQAIAWSPDSRYVAVGVNVTPFIHVFQLDTLGRIVARMANPAVLPAGVIQGLCWSPNGLVLAAVGDTSPFLEAWVWNASTGFGAKFANPATLPAGARYGLRFDPTGVDLICTGATSPFVEAYPVTAAAFGLKYANPAGLPAAQGDCVLFTPSGAATDVILGVSGTPFIEAWAYTPGTGWGAKRAAATAATGTPLSLYLHPDNRTVLAYENAGATPLQCWRYTPGTGWTAGVIGLTAGTQPAVGGGSCVFDPLTGYIAAVDAYAGGLRLYALTPSGTTMQLNGGAVILAADFPAVSCSNPCAVLSPNGKWVALSLYGQPYVHILSWAASEVIA